jgi:hypothetical protein
MRRLALATLLCTAMLAVACSSDGATPPVTPTNPDSGTPQASLQFLRPATGATLSRDSVSFWAVRGQNREVAMYYKPFAGSSDSVRFLRFKVDNVSLLKRPDGTTFATGDSVLITIKVLDFSKLITQFSPSGLTFSTSKPAELRLDFGHCDQDFNHDGVVNSTDTNLVPTFAIWKQEQLGQPWVKLTSAVEVNGSLTEVKADVGSFTNHAVAY